MAANPKYLHPHVSSAITDLSEVFVTAPGSTMLYCVGQSEKGPDNTPTLVTSESELYFYFGEPNFKKYGGEKEGGQAMYNAVNWLRSGGLVVFTRVLPYHMVKSTGGNYEITHQGATYSGLIIEAGLQVQKTAAEWALNNVANEKTRRVAIRTRIPGDEDLRWQRLVDNTDHPKAQNTEKAVRTVKSFESTLLKNVPASLNTNIFQNYELTGVIQTTGNTALANDGTDALYGVDNTSFNSGAFNIKYLWYPLLYFIGKNRGEYYNDFGITMEIRDEDDATYDFRTYDLRIWKDGSTLLEGPYVVSLFPEAVDNSGESLFIEDVVNTYSPLIRCKLNEDNFDEICEYISGVDKDSGDTSIYQKIDILTLDPRNVTPAEDQDNSEVKPHKLAKKAKTATKKMGETFYRLQDNTETFGILSGLEEKDVDVLTTYKKGSTTLGGGTDGSWTLVGTSDNRANTLIQEAYQGKVDPASEISSTETISNDEIFFSEIKKKDKFPIDVILDANHSKEIKDAINKLVIDRGDCVAFVDIGYTVSPRSAELKRSNSNAGDITVPFNTYHTSIFVQDFVVADTFTGRDIRVTPTYFLAQKIPNNDDTFGIHIPFVGPRRGTITGFKEMSWAPDTEWRERLYKNKLNYVEFDEARGLTAFMMQTTSQAANTSLSDINHVRTLLRIRRDVENMMKDYRFETEGSPSWSNLQYSLNNYLEQYKTNGALTVGTATLVASDYDLKQRLMRVQIQLQFSAVIERLFADITVQR